MASELESVRDQRNITFELCAWGFGNVETFGSQMGHLWRTSQDITDTWEGLLWNIDVNDEVKTISRYHKLSNYKHGNHNGLGHKTVNDVTMSLLALYVEQCVHQVRYRQAGVQGPELGWNYPDGLFVGKVIFHFGEMT